MSFANKLFEVVNDVPVYTPVLINLPAFKKLYEKDNSADKSTYAKQLAYIYYSEDYKSPFFDSNDRDHESMIAAFGKTITPTKDLLACKKEYRDRQVTVEVKSLESSLATCDNLLRNLSSSRNDLDQYTRLLEELEESIDQATDLESKLTYAGAKLDMEDKLLIKTKKTAELIPQINKLVESIVELRERVRVKMLELEVSPGRNDISNFLINDFINDL